MIVEICAVIGVGILIYVAIRQGIELNRLRKED